MSHTPTLERISQALAPIFPIELRFTDYTRPEAGIHNINMTLLAPSESRH